MEISRAATDPAMMNSIRTSDTSRVLPAAARLVTVRSDRYRFQRQGSRSSTFVIL